MAFILALIYFALSLLTPAVLPDGINTLPVILIIGILTILACIPSIAESGMLKLPDTWLVTGVLIVAMLSIVAYDGIRGTFAAFMNFIPIIFAYTFIAVSCTSIKRLKILTSVLFLVALFIVSKGILDERAGNFASDYLMLEGPVYRHRGLGVVADPNDLAQFLVTLLPLLWLRWRKGKFFLNFVLTMLPSMILIVGVFQTHSRGGLFALCAVLLFGFKDRLGLVKSAAITSVFVVALIALNASGGRSMDQDDGGRISLWGEALNVFRSHPILGVGMNRFGDFSDNGLTAHNSYVLCLAEIGIVGYFCWMGTIVSSWSGLTMILATRKQKTAEEEEEERFLDSSSGSRFAAIQPGAQRVIQPILQTEPASIPAPNPWKSLAQPISSNRRAWAGAGMPAHLLQEDDSEGPEEIALEQETFIGAARIVRASLVGLLVSAFFLSRTYSMIFYILFGVSAALSLVYRKVHPEFTLETPWLMKRVFYVMVGSIIFLYIFVRFKGGG